MWLDDDELAELKAEYASGKWTLEELGEIWSLRPDAIERICARTPTSTTPLRGLREEWWAERSPEVRARRCTAHRRNGAQCLKVALAGQQVCRTHGGAAPQAKAKARKRLEEAADRMAARLLGFAESENVPAYVALSAVESALDRAGLSAKTAVDVSVELKPWEQLMEGLAIDGIAPITRAESRERRGLPALAAPDPAAPIDAEVVDMGETHPERDGEPMSGPSRADDPPRRPAFATGDVVGPPRNELTTYEQATAELREARARRVR